MPFLKVITIIFFFVQTVEEHMQLSFSHIMKHWKRNPAAQAVAVAGKGPGTRNVLLRFYPPQSALGQYNRRKKIGYLFIHYIYVTIMSLFEQKRIHERKRCTSNRKTRKIHFDVQ